VNTTQIETIVPSRVGAALRSRPVVVVGVVAGLVAAAATEVCGLAARAAGVPMRAGGLGGSESEPIVTGMFALGTALNVALGTVLALLIARFAANPARTWVWTTVVLTVLSLVPPAFAGATATSTKIVLCVAHVVAAVIVVPAVAVRLGAVRSRA